MFPGIVSGWDNQEKALKQIDGEIEGKQDQKLHKVVYHVTTKVCSAVVCRHFASRLRATIESLEEKDGVTHIELTNKPEEAITVEEWIKKRDAPPAAEKTEEKMEGAAEGEMMMEAAAEGEGEMMME